ncbi:MAG: Holliday junction branch migration protein RuvA [Micrococcaceae bacterium]
MISTIKGKVTHIGTDFCIIEVNGVGFSIAATPDTLSEFTLNHEAALQTYLAVKEDSLTLYGFKTISEKSVFETLLAVNGIGAKTALSVLAVYSPEQISINAHAGDDKAFTKVPGIGPKGARRMVLELADKLVPADEVATTSRTDNKNVNYNQALQGLVNLGWNEKQAKKSLDATIEADSELQGASVAKLLKVTLATIGKASK